MLLCVAVVVLNATQSSPETCGVAWGQAHRASTTTPTSTHTRTPRINAPSSNHLIRLPKTQRRDLCWCDCWESQNECWAGADENLQPGDEGGEDDKHEGGAPTPRLADWVQDTSKNQPTVWYASVCQCLESQHNQRKITEKKKSGIGKSKEIGLLFKKKNVSPAV